MNPPLLSIFAAVLIGTTAALPDSIDQAISKYCTGPLWENGTYPIIEIAANTPIEEKVFLIAEKWGHSRKTVKIIKIKEIHLNVGGEPNRSCTAALLKTEVGDKVLVFDNDVHCWSRLVNVN